VLRFNPVPWLTIATAAPETTAPLGSVMVPGTVASRVCGHALAEMKAANVADNGYVQRLFLTRANLMINSLWFFIVSP
jgi:hypothetical protein